MSDNPLQPTSLDAPSTRNSQYSGAVISHHTEQPPTPGKKISNKQTSDWRSFTSIIGLFILAGLLAWLLTVFVFQQYQVDGPSMQTTLQNNNRLIVWKLPRTWSKITGHAYIPKRGDILVFVENDLYNLNGTNSSQLIKRVIGLPGDRVVVKDGVVTIYNKQYPEGFRPDASLPYGKAIGNTAGDMDLVIPTGQIFVCGDNRGDSLDSRVFGTVPTTRIIGKLVLRISPLNEIEKF